MNKVTAEQIDSLIDNAETEEHIFWRKELVVSYLLQSGFTVSGRAACVDPENFDIVLGRSLAAKDAKSKLWQLEGYLLQNRLSEAGAL